MKEVFESLVPGVMPDRPYEWSHQKTKTRSSATSRPRGRPRSPMPVNDENDMNVGNDIAESSTSTSFAIAPFVTPPPVQRPATEIVQKPISKTRRKSDSRARTILQTQDVVVQNNMHNLMTTFAKFGETSTIPVDTQEYDKNEEVPQGAALVLFSKVRPTCVTGDHHSKSEGDFEESTKVHVLCTSNKALKKSSQFLLASHNHVNHPLKPIQMEADKFHLLYPEKDLDDENFMSNATKKLKKDWQDSRKIPGFKIVNQDDTNTPDMEYHAYCHED